LKSGRFSVKTKAIYYSKNDFRSDSLVYRPVFIDFENWPVSGFSIHGLDDMGVGDAKFLKRIQELASASTVGVQPAGAVGCGGWTASIEQSAGNIGLPLSLRMLK
jgi:hypothetical protein